MATASPAAAGRFGKTSNFFPGAGAAGRLAMVEAGAKLLEVPAFKCHARNSEVICGDARVSFGEVVRRGNIDRVFTEAELSKLPIKAPTERRLLGQDFQALDIPEKTRGAAVYGIDAELPGMVFAKPILPPTRYGSTVTQLDDRAAKAVSGGIKNLSF